MSAAAHIGQPIGCIDAIDALNHYRPRLDEMRVEFYYGGDATRWRSKATQGAFCELIAATLPDGSVRPGTQQNSLVFAPPEESSARSAFPCPIEVFGNIDEIQWVRDAIATLYREYPVRIDRIESYSPESVTDQHTVDELHARWSRAGVRTHLNAAVKWNKECEAFSGVLRAIRLPDDPEGSNPYLAACEAALKVCRNLLDEGQFVPSARALLDSAHLEQFSLNAGDASQFTAAVASADRCIRLHSPVSACAEMLSGTKDATAFSTHVAFETKTGFELLEQLLQADYRLSFSGGGGVRDLPHATMPITEPVQQADGTYVRESVELDREGLACFLSARGHAPLPFCGNSSISDMQRRYYDDYEGVVGCYGTLAEAAAEEARERERASEDAGLSP